MTDLLREFPGLRPDGLRGVFDPVWGAAGAGPYGPFKMSFQSYSLRHFTAIGEFVREARRLGLGYVELWRGHLDPDKPVTNVKGGTAFLRDAGLRVAAFGVEDFTTDHEQAAKALRMPLGSYGAFTSPYLSVIDWIKQLPETGNRREILLISDGIDYFRGSFGTYSPDLQPAVELAQRNGIVIYTIYARGVGRINRNSFLIMNAQGGLTQLAQSTGGEAFVEGINSTPISLRPYLEELSKMLGQQYLLAFRAAPVKKDSHEHFKFTTEVPDVELLAPNEVFVPGTR